MTSPAECCILFADLVGSAQLYATLGNQRARETTARALALLREAAEAHGGTLIKTIGDEIMCTFPEPRAAASAARRMHEDLDEATPRPCPMAHIGLHHGPVIHEAGDVFGDAVNVASRLVALAKPRQTLTTRATLALLTEPDREHARLADRTTLKGMGGQLRIYELVWEFHALTLRPTDAQIDAALPRRLSVRCGAVAAEVSAAKASLSLGRQLHNDIAVDNQMASRTHASIEWRRGKFFLRDDSANGTYVREGDGTPVRVHREEHELVARGTIGLGHPVSADAPDAVHYEVELGAQGEPT